MEKLRNGYWNKFWTKNVILGPVAMATDVVAMATDVSYQSYQEYKVVWRFRFKEAVISKYKRLTKIDIWRMRSEIKREGW